MSFYNNWNNVLMMLPLGFFLKGFLEEEIINGIFNKNKNYIIFSIDQGSLGLTLVEIISIIISLILAILIRGLFAKIVVFKIKKLVQTTGNKIDDKLFNTLAPPLRIFPLIAVFILIGIFVNSNSQLGQLIDKINQTLVTVFIFWLLHQSLLPLSQAFKN